jgi:hypothetical protein
LSTIFLSHSTTPRLVRPAESPGHSCREELAGDCGKHFDDHRRRIPNAISRPGKEKGEAGGGGLRIRTPQCHLGSGSEAARGLGGVEDNSGKSGHSSAMCIRKRALKRTVVKMRQEAFQLTFCNYENLIPKFHEATKTMRTLIWVSKWFSDCSTKNVSLVFPCIVKKVNYTLSQSAVTLRTWAGEPDSSIQPQALLFTDRAFGISSLWPTDLL